MAIVPAYPGITQYTRPYWSSLYPSPYYPTFYPTTYGYPAIYQPQMAYPMIYRQQLTYPDIYCQMEPYGYYEPSDYRFTEASYNPGNYFRYPPGQ